MKSFALAMIGFTASSRAQDARICKSDHKDYEFLVNMELCCPEESYEIGTWDFDLNGESPMKWHGPDDKWWKYSETTCDNMAEQGGIWDNPQRAVEDLVEDVTDEIEDIVRDMEREIEDVDPEYEMARFGRELQCLWAGFEPVDEKGCQDMKEFERNFCERRGMYFAEEWWSCFEWDSKDYDEYMRWMSEDYDAKKLAVQKKQMMKYEVSIKGDEINQIMEESVRLEQMGEQKFEEALMNIGAVVEQEAQSLEVHARKQDAADEKALQEMMNYFLQNIQVDGSRLEDILAEHSQRVMMKETPEVNDMNLSWNGPSPQQMADKFNNEWAPMLEELAENGQYIAEIAQWTAEDASYQIEEVIQEAEWQFNDESRDARHAAEDKAEEIVQSMGSWVKQEWNTVQISEMALAQAAEQESSNSIATGFGAGIVGVLAGCAVYAVVNKKHDNIIAAQQPLL